PRAPRVMDGSSEATRSTRSRRTSPRTTAGVNEDRAHAGVDDSALVTEPRLLDGWIVPPDTAKRRKRGRDSGRRTAVMHPPLHELVEEFCNYQRKLRGRMEGGVGTYRWNLTQYLEFVRTFAGRVATVDDLTSGTLQAWM